MDWYEANGIKRPGSTSKKTTPTYSSGRDYASEAAKAVDAFAKSGKPVTSYDSDVYNALSGSRSGRNVLSGIDNNRSQSTARVNSGGNNYATSTGASSRQSSSFPYESLLSDLLAKTPTYTPRSEDELRTVAESKADQQLSSLLSAIASRRSSEDAKYGSGKSDIEAAYASIPAQTQASLEEARNSALESAISRGMGRSGVVDWQTEKLSEPIKTQEAQAMAEKAAKLGSLTNTYNSTLSDLARQEQTVSGGRQSLVDSLLNDLMQQEYGYGQQSNSNTWNQAMGLAGLANSANQYQQSDLYNLLPLLLYG